MITFYIITIRTFNAFAKCLFLNILDYIVDFIF